jgi:post-segregation antitoxin (ccd killing protein)
MDVTLYLPDEIGRWAKESGINLSRTLRDALEALMTRAAAATEADEIRLELEDKEGRPFTGRFTGREVAECVYSTDDDRILFYDADRKEIVTIDDPVEELRGLLDDETYLEACHELGVEPVLDV